MKILIAADGSEYTRRMMDYLARHPTWLGGGNQITVLTVVATVPPRAASVLAPEVLKGYYDDSAESVLAPLRAFLHERGVVGAELVHRVGHAADEIARYATEGAVDLIVMGSHGHGTFSNLVMGSVATKVLASCKTPVLIVR
jgi:nucleotide-binding universal stress UspA family protein